MILGGQSLQQTRDSIGSNPQILPIPVITPERVLLWQEPMIVKTVDPGNSFILGSSVNGILGVQLAGNGEQILLGNYSDEIVGSIVASSLKYYNFLRDTPANQSEYGLVSSQTTATINTSTNKVEFASGSAVTWRCHTNGDRITQAGVFLDTDSTRTNFNFSTNTTLHISATGGDDWTQVQNGVVTTLGTAGTAVWLRINCTGTAGYWQTRDANGYELPIRLTMF